MAGTSQKFSAVIQFGGNLDSSWTRSADGLKKSLKDVDKQSQSLIKDQKKLASELKRAKLAGESITDLSRRYSDVSREIRKTETEQERLNKSLQKAQRLSRFKGMGQGLFRRAAGVAGQLGGMVSPGLAIGGGGVVATALGTLIAPAATNAATAERAGVAKSYGVDVPTFNAWDNLAKQYGMNGENFGDLYEEYLHKSGEYKQNGKQGGLQDAFETLGFKAGDFAGLSDMAQFNKIVERALTLQDESKASFALDSLFGGEASKLLMLLKQSGKSYRDMMDEQRRYNLVTKEGADGAIKGNLAFSNLRTVFSSAIAEISGQLGNELAPDVKQLTDDLAEWFKGGGVKRVVDFLRNDLYPGALAFGSGLVYVGKIVYALAKKLSWLLPDDSGKKKAILANVATGTPVNIARMQAEQDGLGDWFAEKVDQPGQVDALRRQWAASEEQVGWWESRNPLGDFRDKASASLLESVDGPVSNDELPDWRTALRHQRAALAKPGAVRGGGELPAQPGENSDGWMALLQRMDESDRRQSPYQITDNRRSDFRIEIYPTPDQNPEQIGQAVADKVNTSGAFTGDNALYDIGSPW